MKNNQRAQLYGTEKHTNENIDEINVQSLNSVLS